MLRAGAGTLAFSTMPSLLAACGGGDGETTATEVGGAIDFLGWEGNEFRKQNAAFVKKHDLTINAKAMANTDDPIASVRGGRAQSLDVVGGSSPSVPSYVGADILQPFDESKVPNAKNILPALKDAGGLVVDGTRYGLPLDWFIAGMTRNEKAFPQPFTSWEEVLDPALKGKVGFWRDANYMMYLAVSRFNLTPAQVPKDMLGEVSDFIGQVLGQMKGLAASPGDMISQLTSGEIEIVCPGYAWNDIFVAASKGPPVKTDIDIQPVTHLLVDTYAIPNTTDNPDTVYAYFNSLLEPQMNATCTGDIGAGAAVEGADRLQDPAVRAAYPYADLSRIVAKNQWALDPPGESDQYITKSEWAAKFQELTA
jgi:spermidine/putrescine-binding protein